MHDVGGRVSHNKINKTIGTPVAAAALPVHQSDSSVPTLRERRKHVIEQEQMRLVHSGGGAPRRRIQASNAQPFRFLPRQKQWSMNPIWSQKRNDKKTRRALAQKLPGADDPDEPFSKFDKPDFLFLASLSVILNLTMHRQQIVTLMIKPTYHCELAGEGIEYGWGFFKKDYRRTPHAEKKGRDLFRSCVKKSLKKVTVEHIRRFSARARRYMLTYMLLDSPESLEGHGLSYHEIEQYVKKKWKSTATPPIKRVLL